MLRRYEDEENVTKYIREVEGPDHAFKADEKALFVVVCDTRQVGQDDHTEFHIIHTTMPANPCWEHEQSCDLPDPVGMTIRRAGGVLAMCLYACHCMFWTIRLRPVESALG